MIDSTAASAISSGTGINGVSYLVIKVEGFATPFIAWMVDTAGLDTVFTINGDDTRITAGTAGDAVVTYLNEVAK